MRRDNGRVHLWWTRSPPFLKRSNTFRQTQSNKKSRYAHRQVHCTITLSNANKKGPRYTERNPFPTLPAELSPMTLKIDHTPQTVNVADQLLCCFDVSKASLSLYTEYRSESQADTEVRRVSPLPQNRGGSPAARGQAEGPLDRLHPPYGPQKGPSRPDRDDRPPARSRR